MNRGVVVTAGYDRSLHAIATVELLMLHSISVAHIIVVSPFSMTRLRGELRKRGVFTARQLLASVPAISRATHSPLRRLAVELSLRQRSLRSLAYERAIPYARVASLNDPRAVQLVEHCQPQAVLYCGGGVLRRPFIEAAGRRVLNAHSGRLPQVRGMNACEWSVLLREPVGVTVHVIDEGIDTGLPLAFLPVPVEADDSIDSLREKCVVAGVHGMVAVLRELLREPDRWNAAPGSAAQVPGRQCFTMAPVMKELAALRLSQMLRFGQERPARHE